MKITRLLGTLAAAGALSLLVTSTAGAIPIANFKARDDGSRTTFSATLISPATATSCTALARAVMVSYDRGSPRVIKALGRHRINVCQDGNRGRTRGRMTGFFSTTTLKRPYRYAVCISAEQKLRSGKTSRHYACRPVDLY